MKLASNRRYRRHFVSETQMFKKDNQQEQPFFASPSHESFFKPNPAISRKCDHCEAEEKKVQKMTGDKEEEKNVHRQAEHKEDEKTLQKTEDKKQEETVQRGPEKKEVDKMISKKDDNSTSGGGVTAGSYINSLDGKGSSLPKDALHFFNRKMNYDFSNVKVHTGPEAAQSAKEMNAKAYAVQKNIVFNKGQYNPASADGKKLLAHELAHVMQQDNEKNLLNRMTGDAPRSGSGETTYLSGVYTKNGRQNQRDYGCGGVDLQGHTDANYSDSFDPTVTIKPSTTCKDCEPQDCFTATGLMVSKFTASPVVTLPPVPDNLTACETNAVSQFINTTLSNHEQRHVAAFNTYNGIKSTPYKFTGCRAEFDSFMQTKQDAHDALNAQRTAKANALSAALDPFNPEIPCDC